MGTVTVNFRSHYRERQDARTLPRLETLVDLELREDVTKGAMISTAEAHPKAFSAENDRRCRVCGCTDADCRRCVTDQGHPCHWVEPDLCSRCR